MLYPEEGESFVTYDLDWLDFDPALRSSPWYRETKRQNMETENYPLKNRNKIIDEQNNTIYKPHPVKPENDTLDAEDIPENPQDEEQTFLHVNGDQFSSDQDFKY